MGVTCVLIIRRRVDFGEQVPVSAPIHIPYLNDGG